MKNASTMLRQWMLSVTPALQSVSSRLRQRGVNVDLCFVTGSPARLAIPPLNDATGGITVYDEPHELTVELDGKHHSHFKTPEEAADFVADIITEQVCVTVDYLGDRCLGSSHFRLDQEGVTRETLRDSLVGLRGGNIRSERFLWSGPVNEK